MFLPINTVDENSFKTIWYITDADSSQHMCSYTLSHSNSSLNGRNAHMERIAHGENIKYSIYRIVIDKIKTDEDILFRIYQRANSGSQWQPVTHISMLGYAYSNHAAKKYHTAKKYAYAWKMSKEDAVFLLDSRANETNVPMSYFYDKKKHMQYYDEVITKFVMHLYKNVQTHSPYQVLKTLNMIYQLLTDKQQLNWSYSDIPVQSFILSLQSRITSYGLQAKNNWSCLISLFAILCIDQSSVRSTLNKSVLLDQQLQTIYNQSVQLDNLINSLRILLKDDTTLINHIRYMLLLERKRIILLFKTSSVKSYYYLLWYNLVCVCTHNFTQISHKSLIQAVKQQIENSKLNLDDSLFVIALDQRILRNSNKEFLLTDMLMNNVIKYLQNIQDVQTKQKRLFAVIDIVMDTNILYHMLKKYKKFVFGSVIIDYTICSRFIGCLFGKIIHNHHEQLKLFLLNEFCTQIRQISDPQKSNSLFALYNEWTRFMNCSLIQNTILQNDYLMAQKRFIIICSSKLQSMKKLKLKGYLYLWINYFSSTELIQIFDGHGFNLTVLAEHLAKVIENERGNDIKASALCETYKQQHELLTAENKLLNVNIRKQRIELKKSNQEQQNTIIELTKKLKKYENELNQFGQDNVRLKKLNQVQQKTMVELNNKLKIYESAMNQFRENNAKLNEECKELELKRTKWKGKYDELYKIHNIDTKKYRNWNYKNITDWIVSLNEEYKIYKNVLRTKLKEEQLTGLYLCDLSNDDLDRFGIKLFKHKKSIMNEIKKLCGVNQKHNNNLNEHLENHKIEQEGVEDITVYHK